MTNTTADYLSTLIECKEDMKAAIEEKGVAVTGGLTSYADAIEQIDDWLSKLGTEGMKMAYSDFDSIELFYSGDITDWNYMFAYCVNLTTIPEFDTTNAISMYAMFKGCTSLISVPVLNMHNVINTGNMFYGCASLQHIAGLPGLNKTLDLSSCENLTETSLSNILYTCADIYGTEQIYGTQYIYISYATKHLFDDDEFNDMVVAFRNKGWGLEAKY